MAVNKVVVHVETRMQQLDELADKFKDMDMYDDVFSSQEWFDSLSDEDLNTIVGIYGTLPYSDYA